jgi:hypothetical protein
VNFRSPCRHVPIFFFFHPFLLYPYTGVEVFLSFYFNHFTDGRTPRTRDWLVTRPLPKHRTQTQKNAYTHQTSMPSVGFETTITASERAKTAHTLRLLGYSDRTHTDIFFSKSATAVPLLLHSCSSLDAT